MAKLVLGDEKFLGRWEPAKKMRGCCGRQLDLVSAMRLLAVVQICSAFWPCMRLALEMRHASVRTRACLEYNLAMLESDDDDGLVDDEHNDCKESSELDLGGMSDYAIEVGLAAWVLWSIKNAEPHHAVNHFSFAQFLLACKAVFTFFVTICYGTSVMVGMRGSAAKAVGLLWFSFTIFQLYCSSYMLYYSYIAWSYAKAHDIGGDRALMHLSSSDNTYDDTVPVGAVTTVDVTEIVAQRATEGTGSAGL
jgi:hypothetical protein